MKRKIAIYLFFVAVTCFGYAQNADLIPGTYNYEHSWDYKAPDGNGTIHCDEEGTLRFYPDGTYKDDAIQYHSLTLKDSVRIKTMKGEWTTIGGWRFDFGYHCEGRWRVEEGKFLFNEMSEGFSMGSLSSVIWSNWCLEYENKIRTHSTPNSNRWFTFDIERLDDEWFIWSYIYPNGRKDTWEMHRVKPNEAKFGE